MEWKLRENDKKLGKRYEMEFGTLFLWFSLEGRFYGIDTAKRTVVDMEAAGLKTDKLRQGRDADVMTSEKKHHVTSGKMPRVTNEIGSGDHVTQDARTNYGEVDDERAIIRRS